MFIAEVLTQEPLTLKICEEGVMAKVKDFIIWEKETIQFQQSNEEAYKLMAKYIEKGFPLLSGLKSLGVEDGKLHEILPPTE